MSDEGGAGDPAVAAFHAHLDECPRCARNPFDLCSEGERLLRAAVEEDDGE